MGVWDALGAGVQSGVQNWLDRKRLAEEEARRVASEALQREQLGIDRAQLGMARDQYADQQALNEQLRADEKYRRIDPRSDPSRDIMIPMYREMGAGAYVPVSQDERDQLYMQQLNAWEAKQKAQGEQDYQRELELAKQKARFSFLYSKEGQAGANDQPVAIFDTEGNVNADEAEKLLNALLREMNVDYTQMNNPAVRTQVLDHVERRYGFSNRLMYQAWMDRQHPWEVKAANLPPGRPSTILENQRLPIEQASASRAAAQQQAQTENFYQQQGIMRDVPAASPTMTFEEFLADYKRQNPMLPPQAMVGAARLAYNKMMIGK